MDRLYTPYLFFLFFIAAILFALALFLWRKRVNEAIRQREERLHFILNQVPAVFWSTDTELRFTTSLGAGLEALGLNPQEVLGMDLYHYFNCLDVTFPPIAAHLQALQGQPATFETQWGERVFQVWVEPLHGPEGEIQGTIGLGLDITANKQAEAALVAGEKRYRQSVEKSPNPIFSVDFEGRILSWNQACEEVFQYRRELLGQDYSLLFYLPETGMEVASRVIQVFEQQISFNALELIYRRKDGAPRIMLSRLYPQMSQEGKVDACVFANTDITERKHAETALRRQVAELTLLHSVATACVEAIQEDVLIERVTEIIGQTLYTDNFGVMLVNPSRQALCFHPSYRGIPEDLKSIQIPVGEGITGQVAATGVGFYAPDVSKEPSFRHISFFTQSELCVPINSGEQVIGVINVQSSQIDAYTEADQRLLGTVAGQLAIAIERLRAEAAERHRANELLAITRVSREITSVLDRQQILDSITRHAAKLSHSDASGIYIYRPDGRFYLMAAYGVGEAMVREINAKGTPMLGTAVGRAVMSRHPVQIPDIFSETGYAAHHLAEMENIRAILALPMLRGEDVIGGIVLWHRQPRRFTPEEEVFLQALAQQSVHAIENARLFEAEREQRRIAEVLRETGTALSTSLNLDTVLDRLLDQVARVVPYDAANMMMVVDRQAKVARQRGYEQFGAEVVQQVEHLSFVISATENLRQMAESRQPMLISDTRAHPAWMKVGAAPYICSWVGAPLIEEDRVVAFFSLDHCQPGFYQPQHCEHLAIFAGQASLALQNARLFNEVRRRLSEVTLLSKVITLTASAGDLATALGQVCEEVARFFGVQQSAFALINRAGSLGEIIADYHTPDRPDVLGMQIPVQGNPAMRFLLENKRPLAITDAQHDPLLAPVHDLMRYRGVVSILLVPILQVGRVAGSLAIEALGTRDFNPAEIALVQNIASQLGQALERLDLLAKTQEQARQVQQIMDTVPEGVLLLGAQYQIVLANPAAWEFLSCLVLDSDLDEPLETLGGQRIEDLVKTPAESGWHEVQTEQPLRRVFEVAARPIDIHQPREGWVFVLRDVTQERENQTRSQMQERLATVGQLAAGIAHDFNNIMAAIVVYADLLGMDPNLGHSSRARLLIIEQQVQRATSLIRQILDFSRRSVMEQIDLDLLPFIKELDKLLGRILPEHIQLELNYQPGPYLLHADPTRLQQVFMNLALNARDAMPMGGSLSFQLERFQVRESILAPFPGLTPGCWIQIKIADSGSGIAPEVLPHIFEPFFTTKPVGQGTGLGLAQVYGIIQAHGGSIDVRSKLGEGSTFIIYLPEATIRENKTPALEMGTGPQGGGETVLVVEDDRVAREALQALLEARNYRALVADNGLEALEIYEQQAGQIAVVVTDVVMPNLGGVELYQQLKRQVPGIKVLFITGHPLDEKNQSLLERGRVSWIQKPFSVDEFTNTLQELLRS